MSPNIVDYFKAAPATGLCGECLCPQTNIVLPSVGSTVYIVHRNFAYRLYEGSRISACCFNACVTTLSTQTSIYVIAMQCGVVCTNCSHCIVHFKAVSTVITKLTPSPVRLGLPTGRYWPDLADEIYIWCDSIDRGRARWQMSSPQCHRADMNMDMTVNLFSGLARE